MTKKDKAPITLNDRLKSRINLLLKLGQIDERQHSAFKKLIKLNLLESIETRQDSPRSGRLIFTIKEIRI